ncbi:MAG: hypothetical protein E7639_05270, partial [Ruminococcaceae bacterium]|nr:hypothetical protein [Oscillospiraceae bacterium]
MPSTISHETVHWMKRNAPEQYQALEDMVLAALKNANDYQFDAAVKKEYGKYKEKHGQDIDDPTAREEIVARACEDLFGRSEAIKQFLADFAEQNKEAATGFTAAVKKVLARIKAFFENLMSGASSRTLEAGIVRRCGAEVVDGLQEQYEKTFFAALEGNAARNALGEFEKGGVRYSSSDNTEGDSIKEQLKKHLDILNAMEPAIDVQYTVTNKGKARKDASEVFKKAGYRVDRQGFGIIEIGEDQLAESSNYLNTPAEFAAWMSIPKVLKRGAIISGHTNHKQRGFPSVTIAAPVVINGKRGNVAVVVQQKGKNKYHVHRILMPDGSKFVYENIQQNAEPTGDSIVRENPYKGLSIGSASNISIPQNTEKSTPSAQENFESDAQELNSDPEDDVKSDREILASLLMEAAKNPVERDALAEYQKRARRLDKLNARLHEVESDIKAMMFARGKRDDAYRERLDALQREKERISRDIDRWDRKLLTLELTTSLQELLDREKKRTAKLWIEAGRNAIGNYCEKQLCRIYSEKIEEKAKNLGKMLLENSEKYHVPDAFKKPVAAFLSLLDFSSERALRGGDPTQKDALLQASFAEVVTLLQSLTDENSDEYLSGLDLPPDAVDEFVALSKEVAQMAIDGREGDTMVLRRMSSEQLKTLNSTLYAMTRAVRQANELFATERFRHVSELAEGFIAESEQYAARAQRSKLSDLLSWENMVPYYAFKRFGAAGEALFKSFMQGQDKFAFLVKEIIDFTDKLYTEDEVKEWSRQVHTFEGTNGKVYITTAQIMSLYELWKDADARKHILGGGGRIQDISFGAKKKYTNDPNGTALGELVVDAMFAKLTPRQKEVADKLQKFMAGECAKWGNEISYKRWGIRIFGLDYYFPIESDKNTVAADVEQRAKENGLFPLLHKSFTKKRVFNANNRIMIRSVFDVFASHATDMAKYNAFALPLLDMQKFINFKEIVTKEQAAAEAYESAEVNEDIKVLVKKVKGNQYKSNDCVSLGALNATDATRIQKITGKDFSGYEVLLEARQVKHILNRHGENGKANVSMADDSDIAKMQFAMLNADEIRDAGLSN